MDALALAEEIAREAHKGQVDKAGKEYINHPLYVASQMTTKDEKIVALLHDVVEDTHVTLEYLRKQGFSSEIVDAVDAITKRDNEDYSEYLHRVKSNSLARKVKLADLFHNMDISRLQTPTEKDYERLEKYKKAYQYLSTR